MDKYCLLVYGHINFLNDGCFHYFSKTCVPSLFCLQIELFFGVHMCYYGAIALETVAGFFYDSEDSNRHFTGVLGVRPPPWNSWHSTLTMELSQIAAMASSYAGALGLMDTAVFYNLMT